MRLILLPVTHTRSLVYFQRLLAPSVRAKPRLDERVARKVHSVYRGFEHSDKRWKQTIVRWTGRLLDTVPFEENGLRTVPPLNTFKRKVSGQNRFVAPDLAMQTGLHSPRLEPVRLVYPATSPAFPDFAAAKTQLNEYAQNSVGLHKKQMLWCVLGLPLTLPFAINPFMPNFPGMYLVYRLWCNWKAMKGAQHIQHLVQEDSLVGETLPALDEAYRRHPRIDAQLIALLNRIFADKQLAGELEQAQRQVKRADEKNEKNAKKEHS